MKSKVKGDNMLKYWRLVRRWVLERHGLNQSELEMLLFLYSEGRFSRKDIDDYHNVFPFTKANFYSLLEKEYIYIWRKGSRGKGRVKQLYALTPRATGMIKSVYRKLNGEEAFSEFRGEMWTDKANFTQRTYRMYMQRVNKELREMQEKKKNKKD
jgi:hypothetical protein